MAQKLYILSSGVGGTDYLTTEALEALKESQAVVGYRGYLKELQSIIRETPLFMSSMKDEKKRVQEAIDYAKSGKTTCIVSNGDVNVFAMASEIVEAIEKQKLWNTIEVISIAGVTALLATASKIGAPISQDFAVISLSDKHTDIKTINKRVKNSLDADFILGIYNPKSKKKYQAYKNLLKILDEFDEKIVVIASNIGRPKESITITTTKKLIEKGINHPNITISTLIIIGNSKTKMTTNGLVLTPR